MKFVTVQERKIRKKFWVLLIIVALIAIAFIVLGAIFILKDVK